MRELSVGWSLPRRVFGIGLVCLLTGFGLNGSADAKRFKAGATPAAVAVLSPRLERTPDYVLAPCRASARLRLACPHLLPRMSQPSPHWEMTVCLVGQAGCQGLTWDDMNLVDAGDGARPPVWSHVTIYAGDLTHAFGFRYPTQGRRIAQLDGLFAKARTRALFLGAYTWSGKHGTVVLAPDYPDGGEQGGHLIFRWRQAGIVCAVGLHGWEPLAQAFATLKAMVRSI